MSSTAEIARNAITASPHILSLLDRLHSQSESQEKSLSQSLWYLKRLFNHYIWGVSWSASSDAQMLNKFVSLERDKCQLMYLLARSTGAKHIVEAGTSFGVSTIYLALAVGQNTGGNSALGKVIGTEKESVKAARARQHFEEAGAEVAPYIEVLEGDLLQTLPQSMPQQVDMLLLDIWTPLALPTLKIVKPHLRPGAIILVDNTQWGKQLYSDLLGYLHDESNGFKTTTMPYAGGFELAVYQP